MRAAIEVVREAASGLRQMERDHAEIGNLDGDSDARDCCILAEKLEAALVELESLFDAREALTAADVAAATKCDRADGYACPSVVAALRRHSAGAGWREMKSAPKSGHWLGWDAGDKIWVVWAAKTYWNCFDPLFSPPVGMTEDAQRLTHWMPLPAPPLCESASSKIGGDPEGCQHPEPMLRRFTDHRVHCAACGKWGEEIYLRAYVRGEPPPVDWSKGKSEREL